LKQPGGQKTPKPKTFAWNPNGVDLSEVKLLSDETRRMFARESKRRHRLANPPELKPSRWSDWEWVINNVRVCRFLADELGQFTPYKYIVLRIEDREHEGGMVYDDFGATEDCNPLFRNHYPRWMSSVDIATMLSYNADRYWTLKLPS